MDGYEFHPLVQEWFRRKFPEPTDAQRLGWPEIAAGRHTLIAAPTGSGKTLAAFLVCIDRLIREWLAGTLVDGVNVAYVSPLKALSNDIERNLNRPLAELNELAKELGLPPLPIRVGVRTGDTPASERQAMLKRPPHILVTTPESLYLVLTSAKARETLRPVRTVIVDEIHALARDKRGSHLALTLERLEHLTQAPPVRIGLSATQKPMEEIAAFLVGSRNECRIIDTGHLRQLDLALEVPESELNAVCSLEQWGEVYERLKYLVESHRSTLIFVNTRRMAERIAHALTEMLGEDSVASHHGSLSKEIRLSAETRLKAGQLKVIVATASLEMGIDIGYIDLVCQIGSPRGIAVFLQRIGRSGHAVGALPKGRLFPLTRDELLECLALLRAVKRRELDRIEIPVAPLDILAQQIVAATACEEWDENALFDLVCRAGPYRDLPRKEYDAIVTMLAEGIKKGKPAGAYLHRDQINGKIRARRHARLAAIQSGGAIPEKAEYRVVTEEEHTFVGSVDEDFAIDSSAGDIFLLGNTSWKIRAVRGGEVIVSDAQGQPPTIPFWFGEAPGRTIELSQQVATIRAELAQRIEDPSALVPERASDLPRTRTASEQSRPTAFADPLDWLQSECAADPWSAEQATRYVAAQKAAVGMVPTCEQILFERFFDESGWMQLVIHAPLGHRINKAWGLAMRKRFCRSFDFDLQAAADDNGVLLSLSPQHSFPIDALFHMLGPHNAQYLLEQAVLAVPMFKVRWRWNATRALAVLRQSGGKKVPPFLQKYRSEDLLATTFPETVGCLENHEGDIELPDHPLVRQTMHDCLTEAMDVVRWIDTLKGVKEGRVKFVAADTREPSPFSHQLLNAQPYAFLDDAPLEERRTRAVTTRRTLSIEDFRDLAKLDQSAIAQVTEEAFPLVRDPDELHDTLMNLVLIRADEVQPWTTWFKKLAKDGRAAEARVERAGEATITFWFASEKLPFVRALFPEAVVAPPVNLPAGLDLTIESTDAKREAIRGRVQITGPISTDELAAYFLFSTSAAFAALEALEAEGIVMRGKYRDRTAPAGDGAGFSIPRTELRIAYDAPDWCERRLLARIHRLTIDGLRRRIQPVSPQTYLEFLAHHHHLLGEPRQGENAVREATAQLQGFELAAGAWEDKVLAPRIANYDPRLLDDLFMGGELVWGRLNPPKREESDGPALSAITRTIPISLVFREDLGKLLPEDRGSAQPFLGRAAKEVVNCLTQRGALFFAELKSLAGLQETEVEDALRQAAALGVVTSDTFAAIRAITNTKKTASRFPLPRRGGPVGRWSLFPGVVDPPEREEVARRWALQLLSRYGVVFKDLLQRETAAPSWFDLVRCLRRMELRGEVRGGRFISGVAGEQFASESAVTKLRELRDAPEHDDWILVSAADPLNLSGIVAPGPRIAATHKNAVVYLRGRCIAAKVAGQIQFYEPVEPELELAMRKALQVGRKLRTAKPADLPRRRVLDAS